MVTTKPPTMQELFAGSAGAPLFFNRDSVVGATMSGTVVEAVVVQKRDYETGAPEFWDDDEAQPKWQISITLATKNRSRDIEDDNGYRRYFLPWWGPNRNALTAVIQKTGDTHIREGAQMSITFAGLGEQKDRKLNAPKVYEFTYSPPPSDLEKVMTESNGAAAIPTPATIVTTAAADQDLVAAVRQTQADAQAKLVADQTAAALAAQAARTAVPPAPGNDKIADLLKVKGLLAQQISPAEINTLMPHMTMGMIAAIQAV